MSDKILFETDGPIVWITFNRPDRLNALDVEASYAFARPLADRVARSEDAREGTRDFALGRKTDRKGR